MQTRILLTGHQKAEIWTGKLQKTKDLEKNGYFWKIIGEKMGKMWTNDPKNGVFMRI